MITITNLEFGGVNSLPHYAVFGTPDEFYVWVREHREIFNIPLQGASDWIEGRQDVFEHLSSLHESGDRDAFMRVVRKLRQVHSK